MIDRGNTETLILDAAMQVFLEKGRHGARMQEIADRAGINKALLHYYFRSKKNLYAEILSRVFRIFYARITEAHRPGLPFREQLRLFIDVYVDMLDSNPRIPLFLAREMSEGGVIVSDFMKRFQQEMDPAVPDLIVSAIEQAASRGEIRRVDPRHFLMSMIGACIFFFVAKPLVLTIFKDSGWMESQAFVAERKQAVFDLLYNGLNPGGISS
ncbi:TetR/AcrR family transcriptional regulator [bacterium]|nr:TetR/AcrR family transcriptional regulator [bacterium]